MLGVPLSRQLNIANQNKWDVEPTQRLLSVTVNIAEFKNLRLLLKQKLHFVG